MRPIYLDHNATTLMEQGAQRALLLYSFGPPESPQTFGNPSSVHWAGRTAKRAVDEARDALAAALGLDDPDTLLFTASATESINTALKGFFFAHRAEGTNVRVITSQVEHEATLETAHFLASQGAHVEFLPVNEKGELSLELLEAKLKAGHGEAQIVSLLAANNETGVIFPWEEAAKVARAHDATFHLDGAQALGKIPGFSLANTAVDLASFTAHKMGGPKGVGALYVRRGTTLSSLLHGGAQERKRRAGTLNVPGIAAFGAAAQALASRDFSAIDRRRREFEAAVKEKIPGTHILGEGAPRIVNTTSLLFDGVRGEALLMSLDLEGFAVSSGSACNSGSILPSHVLLAMGFDKVAAQSAIRVSTGPETTQEELKLFLAALEKVVARIRNSSAAHARI